MTTGTGLRWWREGKVRPIPGNSPPAPAGKPGCLLVEENLRRSLLRHSLTAQVQRTILGAQYAFWKAWRNLSGPMWFQKQNQTLGWDQTASRWSAPCPGKGTRREDHAPSHRPQMSSDRLFLDRVARQHCPSPLHRHAQTITHPHPAPRKQDISTLQRIGHFYFALTYPQQELRLETHPPALRSPQAGESALSRQPFARCGFEAACAPCLRLKPASLLLTSSFVGDSIPAYSPIAIAQYATLATTWRAV
jgi:hypothetical protein